MTTFTFKDNLTREMYSVKAYTEDDSWGILCDHFGTGYVFENIERI